MLNSLKPISSARFSGQYLTILTAINHNLPIFKWFKPSDRFLIWKITLRLSSIFRTFVRHRLKWFPAKLKVSSVVQHVLCHRPVHLQSRMWPWNERFALPQPKVSRPKVWWTCVRFLFFFQYSISKVSLAFSRISRLYVVFSLYNMFFLELV